MIFIMALPMLLMKLMWDNSRSIITHLLYPQAGTTTEEFSEDLVLWKALQNVSNAATLAMLKLLRHHFPDAKLPLKESKNGRVSLDLDSFTTKNPRNFEMSAEPAVVLLLMKQKKI